MNIKDNLRILEERLNSLADRVKALERCEPPVKPSISGPGEYVTRDGHRAVVYTVNGLAPHYPVVGEVLDDADEVAQHTWTTEGFLYEKKEPSRLDIFPR